MLLNISHVSFSCIAESAVALEHIMPMLPGDATPYHHRLTSLPETSPLAKVTDKSKNEASLISTTITKYSSTITTVVTSESGKPMTKKREDAEVIADDNPESRESKMVSVTL